MTFTSSSTLVLAFLGLFASNSLVTAQTWSSCNPLTQGGCPADPALAKSVNIDFTQGASDSFSASGSPSYGSDGAAFTVARSGDSPTISSKWYMMFGHVDFVLKAAPGTGIVSSAILQSDCLDEIDFEWLGGDDVQVQSNYFGKGQTVTGYNRGAFHGATNNHDQFRTYSIDWTADQIVWSIDGQTVRVLTAADAEAGQYPQTPMMIKVGIWAGGDPSNSWGTIQWAGGQTDYTQGPYTMYLKSIHASDYSTGSSYSYSGTSGTWQSITSSGGKVNSNGKDTPAVASQPAVSTASGAPIPLSTSPEQSSIYATRTGFPWVVPAASFTTSTKSAVATSYSGLPSGWIITDSGKVVPPNTGSTWYPSPSSSFASAPVSSSASEVDKVTTTTYNEQGFPTLTTITISTLQPTKRSNEGFEITCAPSALPSQLSVEKSSSTSDNAGPSLVSRSVLPRAAVTPNSAPSNGRSSKQFWASFASILSVFLL